MELRNLIVKEYLESLTEKDELNRIFPLLLESQNFQILSKPTEYLGISEHGKDIVAVGDDEDGVKKRFYFELKGGADRDITVDNYYGKDGIQDSITQAGYEKFVSAYPEFDDLPLKIVIVHNGIIKGNVQSTLESVFVRYTAMLPNTSFDRWDISKLTLLFSQYLFGPFLLVDKANTRLFSRVLINLDSYEGVSPDFVELIDKVLNKKAWKKNTKTLSRDWKLAFETLKLLAFVIYTESKEYDNLEIAKRYLSQLVLVFWSWILTNQLEAKKFVVVYFDQIVRFYYTVLGQYFTKVIPISGVNNGICSEEVGRYEQVGYTLRTFEVLQYFLLFIKMDKHFNVEHDSTQLKSLLIGLLRANSVRSRPLIDIHSIPIIDAIVFLIEQGDTVSASNILKNILGNIQWVKNSHNRLPDANNNIENVLRVFANYEKSVYYSDSTSPLLTVLFEFIAILDLKDEYDVYRDFVIKHKIDLGVFVPHHGRNSTSLDLIEDKSHDLEEGLFTESFSDGYQSELRLVDLDRKRAKLDAPLNFEEFKKKIFERKLEFEYEYRTDKAGYPFLKSLAHIFYKTPYFPDRWRSLDFFLG